MPHFDQRGPQSEELIPREIPSSLPALSGSGQPSSERDSSLYFVAFHHRDTVRLALFVDLPTAWLFYGAVSDNWAKVLIDKTRFQSLTLADHGDLNYIKRCKDDINTVRDSTPLCSTPYVVAFHENTNIRMATLTDLPSARAFYNTIPKKWAKVLMDRDKFGWPSTVASHGYEKFVKQCTTEILNDNDRTPLDRAPLVVSFTQADIVNTAFFPARRQRSAEAFYDAIPQDMAKIFLDRSKFEPLTLAAHGTRQCVKQCEAEVYKAQYSSSFRWSPYFIAFHQNDAVKVAACIDENSASAFFRSVSKKWAKVLIRRTHSGITRIDFHGQESFVKRCEGEVVKLAPQ
ncbi:hypothetical protein L218DRAFT_986562 [Marasmius fiardii PR-910]|nr:hypothetical protein L218DRAFT_986562 [Marasmius fiardii PR-910]